MPKYLIHRGVTRLDSVLITHMHEDHYGGVTRLIDEGILAGKIFLNFPQESSCKLEYPWGCDWKKINTFLSRLQNENIPVFEIKRGLVLYESERAKLEVIEAFTDIDSPVPVRGLNAMSAVARLSVGGVSALFTGDIGKTEGRELIRNPRKIKSTILKVPHHGVEGIVANDFFDIVGAST